MTTPEIIIATAGWVLPATAPGPRVRGQGLARYAALFGGVEINATFYRRPQPATLARWVEMTPDGFRFGIKIPKTITHERRLQVGAAEVQAFAEDIAILAGKLGPLLVQLPPSLAFEPVVANGFFQRMRDTFAGDIVLEPRHASWFGPEPDALLRDLRIGRVAADPARHPGAGEPGGWPGLAYWRLHGSPRVYYSSYDETYLRDLAARLAADTRPAWCVFDNTASGSAALNALRMAELLR